MHVDQTAVGPRVNISGKRCDVSSLTLYPSGVLTSLIIATCRRYVVDDNYRHGDIAGYSNYDICRL